MSADRPSGFLQKLQGLSQPGPSMYNASGGSNVLKSHRPFVRILRHSSPTTTVHGPAFNAPQQMKVIQRSSVAPVATRRLQPPTNMAACGRTLNSYLPSPIDPSTSSSPPMRATTLKSSALPQNILARDYVPRARNVENETRRYTLTYMPGGASTSSALDYDVRALSTDELQARIVEAKSRAVDHVLRLMNHELRLRREAECQRRLTLMAQRELVPLFSSNNKATNSKLNTNSNDNSAAVNSNNHNNGVSSAKASKRTTAKAVALEALRAKNSAESTDDGVDEDTFEASSSGGGRKRFFVNSAEKSLKRCKTEGDEVHSEAIEDCPVNKNDHFRHNLLFAFNRGARAAEAAREICEVYGEEAMPVRTAQYWFKRFRDGNFDIKDARRSGRPLEIDEERLNQLIHEDPLQTTRALAEQMGCVHSTIERHLHSMGKAVDDVDQVQEHLQCHLPTTNAATQTDDAPKIKTEPRDDDAADANDAVAAFCGTIGAALRRVPQHKFAALKSGICELIDYTLFG